MGMKAGGSVSRTLDQLLSLLPTNCGVEVIPNYSLGFGSAAPHAADLNWPLIGLLLCPSFIFR